MPRSGDRHHAAPWRYSLQLRASVAAAALAGAALLAPQASAQSASTSATAQAPVVTTTIKVTRQRLLRKDKDVASALSTIDAKQIAAEGVVTGSIQTLLTQTPSVNAYSQGPGQTAPTMAIRGVRNSELSETLDGIPLSDLLAGSGNYLSSNEGSPVTLSQIGAAEVMAGVAPPEKQGFGTVGGTIAYHTKDPSDKRSYEITGTAGSFNTFGGGLTINTGRIGDDVDAPKMLLQYNRSETAGYVQNTYSQYQDMMFKIVKPYDDGQSKVSFTLLDNYGHGNVQTQPTPTSLIESKGYNYNFHNDVGYYNQSGKFLTAILSDSTTINQNLFFDASAFYMQSKTVVKSYANPDTLSEGNVYYPNIQVPYAFYGCLDSADGFDAVSYDPTASFGSCEAGEDAENTNTYTRTWGITPKLSVYLPYNSELQLGALIAREASSSTQYYYGTSDMPEINGYNALAYGGGEQRTVFSGYITDKTDFFNDRLHIEPGVRIESAYSSNKIWVQNAILADEKIDNFTKQAEPYFAISYDLPKNTTIYATYGRGSLFAPVSDYYEGSNGGSVSPKPEQVDSFEVGLKYDTATSFLQLDGYLQRVKDAFGYYENYLTNSYTYNNEGGYEMKGIELQGTFKVTPNITLFANGSFNGTKYTKSYWAFDTLQEDQYGYAYANTPFSNVPRWLANYGFDYEKKSLLVPEDDFSARFSGRYTGTQFTTYDITSVANADDDQYLGATVTNTEHKTTPSMVFDAMFTYDLPVHKYALQELKFNVNLQNIFNRHYYNYEYSAEEPSAGSYGVLPSYESALIAPPRNVTFTVSADF